MQTHIGEHHPFLADPDFDPDTKQYVRQDLLGQAVDHLVIRNILNALSGAKTLVNLPYLLRDRLLPQPGAKLSPAQLLEIAGLIAAWTALITVLALKGWIVAFVLVWVVPYLTTFQAANWLIETSEHFPLVWSRSDSFQVTRNRKGPLLERFLTGIHGEGWHRTHHVRPGIPFCNLAKAHAIMMGDPEYAAFEYETAGLFCGGVNGDAPSDDRDHRQQALEAATEGQGQGADRQHDHGGDLGRQDREQVEEMKHVAPPQERHVPWDSTAGKPWPRLFTKAGLPDVPSVRAGAFPERPA